ncbi:MAG: hypothetical protein JRF51_10635 [Deltaproteobacteria bacterium]|nr:hypothetical protein [Deltaproteobacteria bacterium]MBW2353667.1 hypothetical protein [Deltaproteobacteria bacterium]
MIAGDNPRASQRLAFVRPDPRFFLDIWHTPEEPVARVTAILEGFGNDRSDVSGFIRGVSGCGDVDFSFIYGSAVNSTAGFDEIEDVDILVVTRGRKKFVYEWEAPRGTEIRYLRLSEMRDFLRVEKRLFSYIFTREYNSLGGILANGLLVIKGSGELDRLVSEVRRHFQRVQIKALSQLVEDDCRKMVEKRRGPGKERAMLFSRGRERGYFFYGSEIPVTLEEARSTIYQSIRRKNIESGKAPAIARRILKRIKER